MTDVFVLRNQHDEYLNKSHEWIAAGDSKTLYRSAHRDEVINEKVELTVKRPDLRIKVVAGDQQSNGRILVDSEEPLPKALAVVDDENTPDIAVETEALTRQAANEASNETMPPVVERPLESLTKDIPALKGQTPELPLTEPALPESSIAETAEAESLEAETKQRSLVD